MLFYCLFILIPQQRIEISYDINISCCSFQNIHSSQSGTCIFCGQSPAIISVRDSEFFNNYNSGNLYGSVYIIAKVSILEKLVFYNNSGFLASSLYVDGKSNATCIALSNSQSRDQYGILTIDGVTFDYLNFSYCQSRLASSIRLKSSSQRSSMFFTQIHNCKSTEGELVEITNTYIKYVSLIQNNYGISKWGLIRMSYSNSEMMYSTILMNSGSPLLTSYSALLKLSYCYTNEGSSSFSLCTDLSNCQFGETQVSYYISMNTQTCNYYENCNVYLTLHQSKHSFKFSILAIFYLLLLG